MTQSPVLSHLVLNAIRYLLNLLLKEGQKGVTEEEEEEQKGEKKWNVGKTFFLVGITHCKKRDVPLSRFFFLSPNLAPPNSYATACRVSFAIFLTNSFLQQWKKNKSFTQDIKNLKKKKK